MKKNFFPSGEMYGILNGKEDINIHVGFLPQGDFRFPVTIINPSENKAVVSFSVKVNDRVKYQSEVYFDEVIFNKAFHFSVAEGQDWQDTEINFQSLPGSLMKVYYPASPLLFQKIRHAHANVPGIEEKIGFEIKNFKYNEGRVQSAIEHDAGHATEQTLDREQIESFIHSRYFRGLLSMADAEKQLDYVIYNKLFVPDTNKGFGKWKRSVYRKTCIFFYRIIAKNSHRKRYLTKIYRNYINNSIIADNFIDT